jgi:hypothetical protein
LGIRFEWVDWSYGFTLRFTLVSRLGLVVVMTLARLACAQDLFYRVVPHTDYGRSEADASTFGMLENGE